ncbi:MAG: diguanylate cyclase [Hydrogenophaga sp.]|nr:diguanylate cyclase [Hydrogenophaga sp.]
MIEVERRLAATSDGFFKRFTQLWLMLGALIWLLQAVFTPAVQYPGQLMMGVGLMALGLMHSGHPTWARWAFLLPLCVVIVVLPYFINGVRTPLLINMPLLIVLAAWLLGRRVALAVTAIFVIALVAYWAAEAFGGYVPPQPLRPPIVWVTALPPTLVLTGLTIWALLSSYASQLRNEMQLQRDLNAALEQTRLAYQGLDAVSSPIYVKDIEGRYLYANQAVCVQFGRPITEILGARSAVFFDLETSEDINQFDRQVLDHHERLEREEQAVIASTGEARRYWSVKSPLRDAQGRTVGLFGISTDITEKKRTEEALRQAHEKTEVLNKELAAVLNFSEAILLNSPVPMAVYAVNGQCVQANDAYAQLVGATRDLLMAQNFRQTPSFQRAGLLEPCLKALEENRTQQLEIDITSSFGKAVFCECRILPTLLNLQPHLLIQFIDLSDRKRMEDELRHLAFHDVLTRLPNRRLLLDRLQQALHARHRNGTQLAVLYLDLNRFKALNDTHGHDAGDLLLVEVAQRLRTQVRETDTVARLGGDEFVVLLEMPGIDAEQAHSQAQVMADKISRALSETYILGQVRHEGSASIGVTLVLPQDEDPDLILKKADAAMYEVKRHR